jgi:hypothetical protein
MSLVTDRLEQFQKYVALLKGDEKGEAQVFCDRLFLGFGHKGYKEAGAELEYRIKKNSTGGRSFADLMWKPRGRARAAEARQDLNTALARCPRGAWVLQEALAHFGVAMW